MTTQFRGFLPNGALELRFLILLSHSFKAILTTLCKAICNIFLNQLPAELIYESFTNIVVLQFVELLVSKKLNHKNVTTLQITLVWQLGKI